MWTSTASDDAIFGESSVALLGMRLALASTACLALAGAVWSALLAGNDHCDATPRGLGSAGTVATEPYNSLAADGQQYDSKDSILSHVHMAGRSALRARARRAAPAAMLGTSRRTTLTTAKLTFLSF